MSALWSKGRNRAKTHWSCFACFDREKDIPEEPRANFWAEVNRHKRFGLLYFLTHLIGLIRAIRARCSTLPKGTTAFPNILVSWFLILAGNMSLYWYVRSHVTHFQSMCTFNMMIMGIFSYYWVVSINARDYLNTAGKFICILIRCGIAATWKPK